MAHQKDEERVACVVSSLSTHAIGAGSVIEQPVLLRRTYHGTHVADIIQPSPFMTAKGCPTAQHAPQNTRAHGITATPTLCHTYGLFLHKATNHILHWIRTAKTMIPKKNPKVRKHGVALFGQARVRTRGGGLLVCFHLQSFHL